MFSCPRDRARGSLGHGTLKSDSDVDSDAKIHGWVASQLAITCSKLTIETLEQGVKYVQS